MFCIFHWKKQVSDQDQQHHGAAPTGRVQDEVGPGAGDRDDDRHVCQVRGGELFDGRSVIPFGCYAAPFLTLQV